MKYKKLLIYLRRAVFLAVTIAILLHVNAVFFRRGGYATRVGGFQNEPENSFDIIAVGSSHMYCTLTPVYLYEQMGLRSYVYATQRQPPVATYYYVKDALKRQSPDIVIVEALMFARNDEQVEEGVAHDAIDHFPNSADKLKLILEMNQEDQKENYIINFLKYHSRWKELAQSDFNLSDHENTDPYHGYSFYSKATEIDIQALSYDQVEPVEIPEEHKQILLNIKEMVEENGAQLLLLFAPFKTNPEIEGAFKTLHAFSEANGIQTLDLNVNFNELSIDNSTDFYDTGHLNVYGAEKATLYIGRYITQNYEITPKHVDDKDLWLADIEVYNRQKAQEQ